ncbi:MAG: YggS family pyridoxal phosphate-dependent enzyme [Eggerthellaceae bacterium]|nr:YggS family pyridoxal phosphate-dependent enzyme [Eggerthellaceae bacterium]
MGIAERYARERMQVDEACKRAGRNPEDVLLLAVSKTVDVEGAREAFQAGAHAFGENRPDELVKKATALPEAEWHFIGNIQSRRIPDIVAHASLIHSLDSLKHANKISSEAAKLGKVQDVLIEVNVSGEESKSGASPDEAPNLVQEVASLPNVRVRGLMTMAPRGDEAAARAAFVGLAGLMDQIRGTLDPKVAGAFDQMSAGMSEDWLLAVEAGSTIVRIGRAIFSEDF